MKAALPIVILSVALTSGFGQQSRSFSRGVQTYVRAAVDSTGQLRIVTASGREITIKKEPEQVAFDQVAIAPEGRAVGWLAMYPNCCTSYPIPLKLVIYTKGKRRAFTGSGLPVWIWRFRAGGRQVALKQETVHGGFGVHYEVRNVKSGRLVAEYDPEPNSDANSVRPEWVRDLDAKQ